MHDQRFCRGRLYLRSLPASGGKEIPFLLVWGQYDDFIAHAAPYPTRPGQLPGAFLIRLHLGPVFYPTKRAPLREPFSNLADRTRRIREKLLRCLFAHPPYYFYIYTMAGAVVIYRTSTKKFFANFTFSRRRTIRISSAGIAGGGLIT